jgi:transposase-like protein
MECKFCKENCRKAGRQAKGEQRYYCKACKKYQQKEYKYVAYDPGIKLMIPKLVKEV